MHRYELHYAGWFISHFSLQIWKLNQIQAEHTDIRCPLLLTVQKQKQSLEKDQFQLSPFSGYLCDLLFSPGESSSQSHNREIHGNAEMEAGWLILKHSYKDGKGIFLSFSSIWTEAYSMLRPIIHRNIFLRNVCSQSFQNIFLCKYFCVRSVFVPNKFISALTH